MQESLKSGLEEMMRKEEGEKGALQEKELPFIPFPSGSPCQLSHDELAISPSRPGPIPFVSHLPTDPAQAGQCDPTVQLIEREASPRP
jgi:hypothetical protein